MSIPSNSSWRGCAACFPQPVENELGAQFLVEHLYYLNVHEANPPLADIIYRSSSREEDINRHVFRWDRTGYQQVFENGFVARRQEGTADSIYFNLEHYVHHGGRPLDSSQPATHAFVSTTLNSSWRPTPSLAEGEEIEVYRYEIYAPGGIWVAQTLGDLYRYPAQDEVCFVSGIAPQYIRTAQLFRGRREFGSRYIRWSRVDNVLYVNGYFNPQSHPSRLLSIHRPVFDYVDEDGTRKPLILRIFRPQLNNGQREKRQVSVSESATEWYADKIKNVKDYINSAFRASATNEAYLFVENIYVLINYAPGTTDDKVINGPHLICDGFHSLVGTTFGENGIDCAFDTDDGTKAFIFTGNLCAYLDYAPGTTDDKILKGPMTITAMFPFFKHTVFENGIDSAFKATATNEAYLFKGNQYALINYGSNNAHVIAIRTITEGFHSLKNTIFESGIDAAFASHKKNEAYIFKGDQYALINFAPGTTDDYIIGGVKPVLPNWPSLGTLLGNENRAIDSHYHHEQADRDHDEL